MFAWHLLSSTEVEVKVHKLKFHSLSRVPLEEVLAIDVFWVHSRIRGRHELALSSLVTVHGKAAHLVGHLSASNVGSYKKGIVK